ncbi:MAG: hypothetical protein EU533_03940 [Promethearchaeota archaeon]|nr:MAG: hypothetical protein EU533_03940 [Candidatus Lokiarchaeota archaeon]
MIICSNCGATNNEETTTICRKCGALLPLPTKVPRVKVKSKQKKEKNLVEVPKPEVKKEHLDLQEIPLSDIPKKVEPEKTDENEMIDDNYDVFEEQEEELKEEKELLKEIAPSPFKGSILTENKPELFAKQKKPSISPLPKEEIKRDDSNGIRHKQLEEDMTKVLKFLSGKIKVKELPSKPPENKISNEKDEISSPITMNRILQELMRVDLNIEASAIIKSDGTILASAISSRISDSLFATIGQNLTMIGTDIVNGLSAGKLQNISLRASTGVLDLAPISDNNDMLLIIFSNPKVKNGIIYLAAGIAKKKIKEYFGITKK